MAHSTVPFLSAIDLSDLPYKVEHDDNELLRQSSWLAPCSRICAIVGANNTGKTRLLRTIHSELFGRRKAIMGGELDADAWMRARQRMEVLRRSTEDADKASARLLRSASSKTNAKLLIGGSLDDFRSVTSSKWKEGYHQVRGCSAKLAPRDEHDNSEAAEIALQLLHLVEGGPKPLPRRKTVAYIPATRLCRPTSSASRVAIRERISREFSLAHDPNQEADTRRVLVTGEELRESVERMLLGERHQREAISGFEQWIADHFFGGSTVTLLPKHAEDMLHLRIGDKEHPISHFGTGIQNLILILVTLCDWDDGPLMLLIDEPELSMHEGLQRLLVKGLVHDIPRLRKHECQIICTTHSATFLDRTLRSEALTLVHASEDGPSDFSLAKHGTGTSTPTFTLTRRANPSFSVLRSLGAANSSLLLTNCGIWVEGPSDGMYLRTFLRLYAIHAGKNEPVQNLHYAMAHYGGSLVKYLTERDDESFLDIRHFGGNPLVIADRDEPGSKQARKKQLRQMFGEHYVQLKCREVENLLPYSAIRAAVLSYDPGINPPETFDRRSFRNRRLGEFIDGDMLPNHKKSRRYRKASEHGAYATSDGALKDKPEFARRACRALESFADLPKEAQSLTELVYNHIAEFS